MNKEILQKAKDIQYDIERHKETLERLENALHGNGSICFSEPVSFGYYPPKNISPSHFEDWEIRLMIHQKKQRIATLEKQLEEL